MNQSSLDAAPPTLEGDTLCGDAPTGSTPAMAPETDGADAPAVPSAPAVQPVLEKLFELYPQVFGARFLPLKLGVFHDLMAAHPGVFDKASLKLAMGRHARSTAYLQCVAAGHQRHDLAGQPVGEVAPEHVLQALIELHIRRQRRSKADMRPQLGKQIATAFAKSGLSATAYRALMPSLPAEMATLMDEVLEQALQKEAKQAALLRAYQTSGKSVDEFAEMYGLDRRDVLAAFKATLPLGG